MSKPTSLKTLLDQYEGGWDEGSTHAEMARWLRALHELLQDAERMAMPLPARAVRRLLDGLEP